ncbi:MAG: DUF3467 domain-containing protein [Ardenticatenaceae bacterium]|nr:DUF3467 domain-containing protein [Anaerolineales bacterium]MCB8938234.1 DUF3467 domain-containing protein [Ardenticatenaceae bacterium]MCB8975742.1 DUF3467 domain-containing protein [Ardenticatenaceae bacterium]
MSETPVQPTPKPGQKKVAIDIPKELTAVYANLAFISHTPGEMVLDFAQMLPRMPRGRVLSRVIMSPMHAKMLQNALAQNVANYERQFGEIRLPTNLADQFFRFPQQGGDKDDESE